MHLYNVCCVARAYEQMDIVSVQVIVVPPGRLRRCYEISDSNMLLRRESLSSSTEKPESQLVRLARRTPFTFDIKRSQVPSTKSRAFQNQHFAHDEVFTTYPGVASPSIFEYTSQPLS